MGRAAGAVVGWRDAPGQGGGRRAPATEDQQRAAAACGGGWRPRACTDGAAWSKPPFRRNRGKGAWVRHARYLAREHAQREGERGRGFDRVFERSRYDGSRAGVGAQRRVDVVIYCLAGRRRADRFTAARARFGGRDGAGPRHPAGVGRDRSPQHRQRARSSADSGRARRRAHADS